MNRILARLNRNAGKYDDENFGENLTDENWDFLTKDFPAASDANIRKGVIAIMEDEENPKMRDDIIDLCKYAYDNGFTGQYFNWFVDLMIEYRHGNNAVGKGKVSVDCWKDFLGEINNSQDFVDLAYASQHSIQNALSHADQSLAKDFVTPGKAGDDIRQMILEVGNLIGSYDVKYMTDYFMVYVESDLQTAIDLANWKKSNNVSSKSFGNGVWRDVRRAFVLTNEDMQYMSFLVACGKTLKENEVPLITEAYLNNEFNLSEAMQIVENGITKTKKPRGGVAKFDVYDAIIGNDTTASYKKHIMRRWARMHNKVLKNAMVLANVTKKKMKRTATFKRLR